MSRIRCFVAAPLPDATRAQLGSLQQRLQQARLPVRWVRPGALHLTLKFLGELLPATFDQVVKELSRPLLQTGPLQLLLRGVGTFPAGSRARVVWCGVTGDTTALARLALEVDARALCCSIERERRPFSPHVTLGRSTRLAGLGDATERLREWTDFAAPAFTVHELVLYESRLAGAGAHYLPRLSLPLGGEPFPG